MRFIRTQIEINFIYHNTVTPSPDTCEKILTLQRDPGRIWSVIEVNISYVEVRDEDNPIPGEKSGMTVDSAAPQAMTDDEKYKAIIAMESIDPDTTGRYPTKARFLEAMEDGGVAGDFVNRVVMVAGPQRQYRFTKDTGTGRRIRDGEDGR